MDMGSSASGGARRCVRLRWRARRVPVFHTHSRSHSDVVAHMYKCTHACVVVTSHVHVLLAADSVQARAFPSPDPLPLGLDGVPREVAEGTVWPTVAPRMPRIANDGFQYGSRRVSMAQYSPRRACNAAPKGSKEAPPAPQASQYGPIWHPIRALKTSPDAYARRLKIASDAHSRRGQCALPFQTPHRHLFSTPPRPSFS
eukprot:9473430-Pyramimonas_sp.AAC.1